MPLQYFLQTSSSRVPKISSLRSAIRLRSDSPHHVTESATDQLSLVFLSYSDQRKET